jgi:hypothetical protein
MEASLAFGGTLSQAWSRVKGFKGTYIGAFLLNILITLAVFFVIELAIGFVQFFLVGKVPHDAKGHIVWTALTSTQATWLMVLKAIKEVALFLVKIFISWPLLAGMLLIVLHCSAEKPVRVAYLFRAFSWRMIWQIAGLLILVGIFVLLPVLIAIVLFAVGAHASVPFAVSVIFVVVGVALLLWALYLGVSYMLSLLLLLDRAVSISEAMRLSRKTVTPHWFKVFFLFVVCILSIFVPLVVALIVGALLHWLLLIMIPLFIASLVWTLPWVALVHVTIYKALLGVAGQDVISLSEPQYLENPRES